MKLNGQSAEELFQNTKYIMLEDAILYTKWVFHKLTIQMSLLLRMNKSLNYYYH